MSPNPATSFAPRSPAWGVAATALIAVASALFVVAEPTRDTVAANSTPPDQPLHCAQNRLADGSSDKCQGWLELAMARVLAPGSLTLHL